MSFGMQISQQGVPLDYAADYQKVLDTNWELLEILDEVYINLNISMVATGYAVIPFYTHNLGHPAAFEFFPDTGTTILKGLTNDGFTFTDSFGSGAPFPIQSDAQGIYATPLKATGDPNYTLPIKGLLRIYTNDITKEFLAPKSAVSSTAATNEGIGAKIVKPGRSMSSQSGADFSLNSNFRPINIHQHGLQTVGTVTPGKLTITHNIGYRPTYYVAFYSPNTGTSFYPNPFQGSPTLRPMLSFINFASADNYQITLRGAQAGLSGTYAYLILKDPVDVGL